METATYEEFYTRRIEEESTKHGLNIDDLRTLVDKNLNIMERKPSIIPTLKLIEKVAYSLAVEFCHIKHGWQLPTLGDLFIYNMSSRGGKKFMQEVRNLLCTIPQ